MATANDSGNGQSGRQAANELQVEDPEDYNQNRRLAQIHDARQRFQRAIREEGRRAERGDINNERYRELVAEALIEYLIEIEPVIARATVEDDEDHPWDETAVAEDGAGEVITLERIVDGGGWLRVGEDKTLPSINQCRQCYRHANRYLAEVGLGVKMGVGLPGGDRTFGVEGVQ
jgi:hypothetical protein